MRTLTVDTPQEVFHLERVALVGVLDLRWFELTCAKCKSSVTFDMAAERPQFPEFCPACRETWNGVVDKELEHTFNAFKKFYGKFGATNFAARFRVSVEKLDAR